MSPRVCASLLCAALLFLQVPNARADPPASPAESAHDQADDESSPGTTGADSGAPLDLNRADERALLALPGIGPARARAILAFRAAHGGFHSVSQLLQIKGIGRALLKQLRPLVALSPAARASAL